jgi:hypothetical protein
MHSCVLGQGYVGLPLALRAAESGRTMPGSDPDQQHRDWPAERPTSRTSIPSACSKSDALAPTRQRPPARTSRADLSVVASTVRGRSMVCDVKHCRNMGYRSSGAM